MSDVKLFHHGRFAVAGGTLPDAVTAYRTYGDPKNPCIVSGVCFGGRIDEKGPWSLDWMIGEGLPLDPSKYFIVTFALFGGGQSSSPSNTPVPYNGPYFPKVTYEDNVRAQYDVITKGLNLTSVFCVVGFSMGGQQAYYWASLYPDFVNRIVCICGAARTGMHSVGMIASMKYAMQSAKDFHDGHYTSRARIAIGASIRIMSAWLYTIEFFNKGLHLRGQTYKDIDDYLLAECDGLYIHWDANDLLALMNTWQAGDISRTSQTSPLEQGDLAAALAKIKAKVLLMPAKGDMFFPVEDNDSEIQALKNTSANLVVIPSELGHAACGGYNPPDAEFMANQLQNFFNAA